jgi:O-antigen/teichoic acid export membrane protein
MSKSNYRDNYGMMDIYGRGIIMAKRSFQFGVLYFTGAVINIALNYYLIPKMGIMGAAISTLVAYFYISIVSAILSKKYYEQTFEWMKIIKITFLAILLYSLIHFINVDLLLSIFLKIIVLVTFAIVVYFLIIKKDDRVKFKEFITKRIIK